MNPLTLNVHYYNHCNTMIITIVIRSEYNGLMDSLHAKYFDAVTCWPKCRPVAPLVRDMRRKDCRCTQRCASGDLHESQQNQGIPQRSKTGGFSICI